MVGTLFLFSVCLSFFLFQFHIVTGIVCIVVPICRSCVVTCVVRNARASVTSRIDYIIDSI